MALNPNPITPGTPISPEAGAANGAAAGSLASGILDDEFMALLVGIILGDEAYMVGDVVRKKVTEWAIGGKELDQGILRKFFEEAVESFNSDHSVAAIGMVD